MSTKKLQIIDSLVKQAENANTLDGKSADEFASAADVEELQTQVDSKWNHVSARCTNYADLDLMLQNIDTIDVHKTIINLTITSGGELNIDLTTKNGKDTYGSFLGIPYLYENFPSRVYGVKLVCLEDNSLWHYIPDNSAAGKSLTKLSDQENTKYTNLLPLSTDTDGSLFNNGKGWVENTRLNSSGTTTAATGIETTGFIPFKRGDVIRFKNIKLLPLGDYQNQQYFITYDSNKNKLVAHVSSVFAGDYSINGGIELDADGNLSLIKTDALPTDHTCAVPETAAYFRISAEEITDESIITVNEEIITNVDMEDVESRVVSLENDLGIVKTSINTISDDTVTEAESVINKTILSQGNNTFTFAAITDMHYGNSGNTDGIKHACQALNYISSRIKLDALVVLGDYTDGLATTSQDEFLKDVQTVNSMLAEIPLTTPIRVMGNHDFIVQDSPITTRYINAYNDGVSWGSKSGGYFYRDFEDHKLRIIVVNTSETSGDGLYCSDNQYNWFITALDLSSKSDASDWQTLILSHMPLDWFAPNGYVFHNILKAYLNGSSYSSGNISCDFSGKNSAKIIGNIHGHIHNLLVRDIADGQPNTTENTITVKRIATPEACVGRANSYNGQWTYNPFGEETSYPKTVGSVDDTSFCVYCINLDTLVINAICYGAGYDRVINYSGTASDEPVEPEEPTETINWLLCGLDTDGSIYNDGTGWKDGYRLNSSGVESEQSTMSVTGYIPVKVGDVIRIRNAIAGAKTSYAHYYDKTFNWLGTASNDADTPSDLTNATFTVTNTSAKYFRATALYKQNGGSYPDTIITVNQTIE